MSAETLAPRLINERISQKTLLESARKVRVAMDEVVRKTPSAKPKGVWAGIEAVLDREFSQPGMKEAGLVLAGLAVIVSALLALHVYDMNAGGDGIVVLNTLADLIDR